MKYNEEDEALSHNSYRYKKNCVSFLWETSPEWGSYCGQGDFRLHAKCKLNKLKYLKIYVPEDAAFACPLYCSSYEQDKGGEMNEYERVREQIADNLRMMLTASAYNQLPTDEFYSRIDEILSIEGIEIKSDDQELPENPIGDFIPDVGKGQQWAYSKAQRDMLKPDSQGSEFVKVIKK